MEMSVVGELPSYIEFSPLPGFVVVVFSSTNAEETSGMALYAIRSLWSTLQLDKSDTSESCTDDEEDELSERKRLSLNLSQTLRTRQLLINFHGGRPVFSLRAPLDLINFPTIPCPRWPIECDVIGDIIQHIEWEPPEPEPFYQPTGHERTPMPVGEERGKVVYCSDPATKCAYFTCSRAGGNRGPIKSTNPCVNHTDFTLEFESRFESGNLQKAVQVGVYDYELTLRTDMYTMKHTQWFYFRVRNMKAGVTYRFTIVNLMKSSSLYSHGLRPLLYSERAAEENAVGWQRIGSNIKHYRSCSQSTKNNSDAVVLYSFTWTFQFPYESDTCYLAHCYPYTYSHLQRYLRRISSDPAVASYCQVRVLCHSLAGNAVYVVTVTSKAVGRKARRNKKAVVVTARVHPGETNGSWVMEGLLDFLLGDSDDARLLRDTFVFKVVPMLNPDGVVVGNYRCSLAGRDLNRNYKTLLRDSFPCVWHTRKMVERLMSEMDVVLYCDFHGHNRKNNAFMYGCNSRGSASLQERVFPLMMSKNGSTKFAFKSCKFRVQRSKEGTGRIVMWRLGIKNSYTMEASFGGSTLGDRKGTHFTTKDLKSLGFCFCDTLLDFCDPDPTKVTYCLTELATLLRKEVRERMGKDLGTDCSFSVSDLETSTSGSNSSDSDGLPVHLLNQQQADTEQTGKKKKKRLRTRKERNKQQKDRVKNNTEPKEFNQDGAVKESIQDKPAGRHRRKWQLSDLMRKARDPPPNPNLGEVSQVTLWQGCKPVHMEDECLETLNAPYLHHKTELCPNHNKLPAVSLQAGAPVMRRQQRRCCSQLLHLRAINPSPPKLTDFTKQPRSHPQRASHKVHTSLFAWPPPSIKAPSRCPPFIHIRMIPPIQQTKRPQATFTTTKLRRLHSITGKNAPRASEPSFVSEDSSTSGTDITRKRLQNDDQETSEASSAHF